VSTKVNDSLRGAGTKKELPWPSGKRAGGKKRTRCRAVEEEITQEKVDVYSVDSNKGVILKWFLKPVRKVKSTPTSELGRLKREISRKKELAGGNRSRKRVSPNCEN